MKHYSFLPELILRAPKNSFSSDISMEYVLEQMNDKAFQESIFLASPSLYISLMEYLNDNITSDKHEKNIINSCIKYILRSRSRATPFGLFSSIGIVKWGGKLKLSLILN